MSENSSSYYCASYSSSYASYSSNYASRACRSASGGSSIFHSDFFFTIFSFFFAIFSLRALVFCSFLALFAFRSSCCLSLLSAFFFFASSCFLFYSSMRFCLASSLRILAWRCSSNFSLRSSSKRIFHCSSLFEAADSVDVLKSGRISFVSHISSSTAVLIGVSDSKLGVTSWHYFARSRRMLSDRAIKLFNFSYRGTSAASSSAGSIVINVYAFS